MSIYDKASLVLIPSGTKTSKVYSQVPTNGDGDFTFSRSTAATRVNASGNIEKETQNLFTYSNTFSDSSWYKVNTSVTGGQSGYDGTNDAWLLSKSAASAQVYKDVGSNVSTYSIYAKAGTLGGIRLVISTTSTYDSADFDLTNGVLGAVGSVIDASIEDVGGGWYRCSIVGGQVPITRLRMYPATSAGSIADASGSIYIQDAQLEQGLVARDYIETTTAAVYGGITDNVPRLDYQGSCPTLLLEPQRTNIATNSEYMLGFAKGTTSSLEANATTSPEGKNNATYFYCNATTTNAYLLPSFNGTSGVQYAVSFYAKAKELNLIYIKNVNDSGGQSWFDLSNGTYNLLSGIDSMNIESVGDGWYRCTAVSTSTSTGIKWIPILKGDANEGVYVYGVQVEQGSYATSYIPTYGSAVTRNGETCVGAGNASTFNATEGVFYAEISTNTDDTDKTISLNNGVIGSTNNRLWMGYSTAFKRIYALGYVNNSLQFVLNKTMTDETLFVKIACKYALNDVSFFVNGEKVATDTSALAFTELTSLDFNIGNGTAAAPFYGNAKQVLYFPTALTDQEAIDLTTI